MQSVNLSPLLKPSPFLICGQSRERARLHPGFYNTYGLQNVLLSTGKN